MRLHTTEDVEEYAAAVIPFLEASPCSRNVLRWIIELARAGAGGWVAPALYLWVSEGPEVIAAASWTAPYYLTLTELPAAVVGEAVAAVRAHSVRHGADVLGVSGTRPAVTAISAAWRRIAGEAAREHMAETLYELRTVREVRLPSGGSRPAAQGDVEQLARWLTAFVAETGVPSGHDPAATIRHMIERSECDVWVDGGDVASMAGHRGPLAGVVRVGPVYTPPDRRGRGYARRLVAEISDRALRTGATRCMLFADQANPVSNAIYRQIGYAALEERVDVHFMHRT